MRKLLLVLLLVTGCASQQQRIFEGYIGKPVDSLIVKNRVPDKQYKLEDGRILYQWDNCGGNGFTDSQGQGHSSYGCSHTVAVTKDGIIEKLSRR